MREGRRGAALRRDTIRHVSRRGIENERGKCKVDFTMSEKRKTGVGDDEERDTEEEEGGGGVGGEEEEEGQWRQSRLGRG